MISRTLKAAGVSSLALLACMPNPSTAQFGVAGNKRKGGAASFEELNKLAAERADGGAAAGGMAGLEDMLGDLGGMDLGALMEGLDPNTLQELIAEGMKDPAIQEMVRFIILYITELHLSSLLFTNSNSHATHTKPIDEWNAGSHGRTT